MRLRFNSAILPNSLWLREAEAFSSFAADFIPTASLAYCWNELCFDPRLYNFRLLTSATSVLNSSFCSGAITFFAVMKGFIHILRISTVFLSTVILYLLCHRNLSFAVCFKRLLAKKFSFGPYNTLFWRLPQCHVLSDA